MYDIAAIKSRMTCIDYAQRIGLSVRRDGDRCKSPLRANATNKSSFSVTKITGMISGLARRGCNRPSPL